MSVNIICCLCLKVSHKQIFNSGWRSYSKVSYFHQLGKEPLRYSTVGRILEKAADKYESREAIVSRHQNRVLTFEEVLRETDKFAAGLRKTGLNVGDRVGLWAPNLIEWYIGFMACARAGFVAVALNPAYQAPEMEYSINKVGIKGLICSHKFKTQNYYDILKTIATSLGENEPGELNSSKLPTLKTIVIISDEKLKGTYSFKEVSNIANENEIKQIRKEQYFVEPDDKFNILFTSGTTGKPKAALLSHFNLVNNSYDVAKRNELHTKHQKICVQVPFFHVFGTDASILSSLHFGSTIVLPGISYNANESLDAIKEERCTVIYGTPTMYVDLVRVQMERQEHINPEIAVVGGSPCSPHLFGSIFDGLNMKKIKSIYGLTETTAVVFQSLPSDDLHKSTTTVGQVSDHVEAKVIDADGKTVPFGTPGELCVRSYATMLEYWGDEEKTKEIIGSDRWLRTGDQFVLEENGYGRVIGRLKDTIIRGGENIYPKEIEDFLNAHPHILESQVIGVPDERLGEEVCAFVRLKQGTALNLKGLKEYCKGQLAHFKIPSHLRIIDEFPKTTSGKIQKFKLIDLV